jgi:hypothetical protein
LASPDVAKELKLTDAQRKQFFELVQQMEKKIYPLLKEAQSGSNPEVVRPKVMKIRKAYESKIEVILSEAQKKQWQKMRGKAFVLGD